MDFVKVQDVLLYQYKGICCVVALYLAVRQLSFSLYIEAVTTKVLTMVVPLLLSLVSCSVEYPMPYASCLVSCSVVWRYSCSSAYRVVLCLMQLSLSPDLGFCSSFYLGCFHIAPWDNLSGLCALWEACLASQTSDWAGALWDGLSGL